MTTHLDPNKLPQPSLPCEIGGFRILEPLGKGSFGTVYKAVGKHASDFVAIKFTKPKNLNELLSELQPLSGLKHPNIIGLRSVGSLPDGRVWFAVDFVDGETLADRLLRGRPAFNDSARWIRDIADALHHAHQNSFYHRDVKPANILIDKSGRAFLADFGLAVHETGQMAVKGELAGTPKYMSPEQARGESHYLDGRSDIWSLGAVFYELLTGRPPFTGTIPEILDQIKNRPPKPPQQLNDEVPLALSDVALRCMQQNVADRFNSAKELSNKIAEYLQQPAPPAPSVAAFLRRLSLLAASLLISVAAVTYWFQNSEPIHTWLVAVGIIEPPPPAGIPPTLPPCRTRADLSETSFRANATLDQPSFVWIAKFPDGLADRDPAQFHKQLHTENCSVNILEHDLDPQTIGWIKIRVVPKQPGKFVVKIPDGLKTADGSCEYSALERAGEWRLTALNLKLDRIGDAYCRDLMPLFRLTSDGELHQTEELAKAIREASSLTKLPLIRSSESAVPLNPSDRIYDLIVDLIGDGKDVQRAVEIVVPVGGATTEEGRRNENKLIANVFVDTRRPQIERWNIKQRKVIRRSKMALPTTVTFSEAVQLAADHHIEDLFEVTGATTTKVRLDDSRNTISFEVVPGQSGPLTIKIRDGFLVDVAENPLVLRENGILNLIYAPLPTSQEIQRQIAGPATTLELRIQQVLQQWEDKTGQQPPWQFRCLIGTALLEMGMSQQEKGMADWRRSLELAAQQLRVITQQPIEIQKTPAGLHASISLARCLVTLGTPQNLARATTDDYRDVAEARDVLSRIRNMSDESQFQAQWHFVRGFCARALKAETDNDVFWHFADSYQRYPTARAWELVSIYRQFSTARQGKRPDEVRERPDANPVLMSDDQVLIESHEAELDQPDQ